MFCDTRGVFSRAWKDLGRFPLTSLSIAAIIALGMAANVAIYVIADSLVIAPLTGDRPETLARVYREPTNNSSYPDYVDYRDRNRTFAQLAAYQVMSLSMREDGLPEHHYGEIVSGEYFSVLGIRPLLGRLIEAQDASAAGSSPVAVISYSLWRSRFAGRSSVVGESIRLNGVVFAVIGVTPAHFISGLPPYAAQIWVPMTMDPILRPGTNRLTDRAGATRNSVHVIGRLKNGVTVQQAQHDLASVAAALAKEYPASHANRRVSVRPGRALHHALEPSVWMFVGLLAAVAGLLQLLVCINAGGLMMAQALRTRRDAAVRMALGATPATLASELVIGNLLLAAAGALVACAEAAWALAALARMPIPSPLPIAFSFAFNWRVFIYATSLTVASVLLVSLCAAVRTAPHEMLSELRDHLTTGSRRHRTRTVMVIGQVVVTAALLITAGLFVRTVANLRSAPVGFEVDGVLTANLDLEGGGRTPDQVRQFYRDVEDAVRRIPGVVDVNLVESVPLTLGTSMIAVLPEGRTPPPPGLPRPAPIATNVISPRHFATLRIPIVQGRDFRDDDTADRTRVAIVNETLARQFWPQQSPIGKRLQAWRQQQASGPPIEVVGVVADSKYATISEATRPFVYRPLGQSFLPGAGLLVRTVHDPSELINDVRTAVYRIDPDVPVFDIRPLRDAAGISRLPAEAGASLLIGAAVVGLVLSLIGLYSLLSGWVADRETEFRIRQTLGASVSTIAGLVFKQGGFVVGAGLSGGSLLGWMGGRAAESWLFGVYAFDVPTLLVTSVSVLACSGLAMIVPAWQATRLGERRP